MGALHLTGRPLVLFGIGLGTALSATARGPELEFLLTVGSALVVAAPMVLSPSTGTSGP